MILQESRELEQREEDAESKEQLVEKQQRKFTWKGIKQPARETIPRPPLGD